MSDFLIRHSLIASSVVKIAVLLFMVLTALAYLTWFERKVVAHIQSRWGPYRVGPHGLLQPLADGLKFIMKEDPMPAGVDKFVFVLAPLLAMTVALTALGVIPFGPQEIELFGRKTSLAIVDLNLGLLFLFAISSLGVYGVALAGWASNSKYPLLGGLRSSAQMVSYELALTLSVVGVVLMAGSLSLRDIIQSQSGWSWHLIPRWNLFAGPLPQVLGFFCYFTAAIAETNRAPFDLAEAEQELVGGFHTEYSSMKFAMFFMAEYANMVTVSCLATILFFGGWLSPFPATGHWVWTLYLPAAVFVLGGLGLIWDGLHYTTPIGKFELTVLGVVLVGVGAVTAAPFAIHFAQGPFWFLTKVLAFLFVYVWVRGTLPRFRYDQLMAIGWKLLLPVSLANVVFTSLALVVKNK
ncbi:MAG TPA: NADH-quinone oxidoreductase subunit NuoH [Candidatus Limnocylindrales bacterium]|nr:NADH-quinone oxidoreductase subunit NuoH [Candidatus Limnocylindrales bacterium]